MRGPRFTAVALAAIVLAGLAARAIVAEAPGRLISRDGIRYARLGRAIAERDTRRALADDYPPGYPLAIAAAGRALGARSDLDFARAAVLVSVVAGALTALAAFAIARRAAGPAAGLGAAVLLAAHARHMVTSADALSEPLFGLLLLASIAAAVSERGAPLAGVLGAAAFLVRPEGILTLIALPPVVMLARPERRILRGLLVVLPFALLALPYVAFMSGRAHALVISQKKLPLELLKGALADPRGVCLSGTKNFLKAWEVGPLGMALGAAGAVVALGRGGTAGARRVVAALGLAFAAFLHLYAIVRVDNRFALVLSLIALPAGGIAIARVVDRAPRPGLAFAAIAALLVAVAAPLAVHAARPDKAHYLDCARAIAAEAARRGLERPRVEAYDPRIAFYAGAVAVPEGAAEAEFRVVEETGAAPAPAGARRFAPPEGERGRTLVLVER